MESKLRDRLVLIYEASNIDDYGILFEVAVDAIWHHMVDCDSEANLFHEGLYRMGVCNSPEEEEDLLIKASEIVFKDSDTIPYLSTIDLFNLCFEYSKVFEKFIE